MASSANLALPADCPPSDAVATSAAQFYRLTSPQLGVGDQAPADDWIVPHNNKKGDCAGCPERCECHAHSLFRDLADLAAARSVSPWIRRKSVALLTLSSGMGKIRRSPTAVLPSHHDWWPADPAVVPAASVVEVVAS